MTHQGFRAAVGALRIDPGPSASPGTRPRPPVSAAAATDRGPATASAGRRARLPTSPPKARRSTASSTSRAGTGAHGSAADGRPGHIAVQAVCQESVFWETLERLKAAGASAILVMPIEKMML